MSDGTEVDRQISDERTDRCFYCSHRIMYLYGNGSFEHLSALASGSCRVRAVAEADECGCNDPWPQSQVTQEMLKAALKKERMV